MSWVKSLLGIYKFLNIQKKVEKKYPIFKTLKDLGLASNNIDFESIYSAALYNYTNAYTVPIELSELFQQHSVKYSFKKDFIGNTNTQTIEDLNTHVATNDRYAYLAATIQQNLMDFSSVFYSEVEKSRLPKEKVEYDTIKGMDSKIDQLLNRLPVPEESIDLGNYLQNLNELRKSNKHTSVLDLLAKFKTEKWDSISNDIKYKVQLNLGLTYFELGKKEKAAEHFIDLLNYKENNDEVYAFAAMGYSLKEDWNNTVKYANKAIELNPKASNAYLALLYCYEDTKTAEEIQSIIPADIQKVPEVAYNIGAIYAKKGYFQKAYKMHKEILPTLDDSPFKIEVKSAIANDVIFEIMSKSDHVVGQITTEETEKIKEAIDLLTECWDYYKNTDLRNNKWHLLTHRGLCYEVLDDFKKAEQDFFSSLEVHENFVTYKNLIVLKIRQDLSLKPILDIVDETNFNLEEKLEFQLYRSTQYSFDGKLDDAVKSANEVLKSTDESNPLYKNCLTFLVESHLRRKDFDSAEAACDKLKKVDEENPLLYMHYADIARMRNDQNGQHEYLLKAKEKLAKEYPFFYHVGIASRLFNLKDYEAGQKILEGITNTTVLSELSSKLLNIYYRQGNHKKALEVGVPLFKKHSDSVFLADILSVIYETIGDHDSAIKIIEAYLAYSNDKVFIIKKAMNLIKKGDLSQGVSILEEIELKDDVPLQVRFMIAKAYVGSSQKERGLEMAYQLRRENYNDHQAHILYMNILTFAPQETKEKYFPHSVQDDSYVVVEDDHGKKTEFIICTKPRFENEIAKNEKIAMQLIGKGLFETMDINGNKLTIKSILWKYTYALHDSMDQIDLRFGNSEQLQILKAKRDPNKPFQEVFDVIDNSCKMHLELENFYLQGQTTIGSNASYSGLSPIKYWSKLVSNPNVGIFSIGEATENALGIAHLKAGNDIVCDITSILTLYHLKALNLLKVIPNRKIVPSTVVELIKNEIAELKRHTEGSYLTVQKIGGVYYKHEVSVDESSRYLEVMEELLQSVLNIFDVILPPPSSDYFNKKHLDELLGESFNDAKDIAATSGVLLSDDLNYRRLAYSDLRVSGFCSLSLLHHIQTEKVISKEDFEDFIVSLVKLNYRYVPLNPPLLYKIYDLSGFSLSQPFLNACDILNRQDDKIAVIIAVDFLYKVYSNIDLQGKRDFVAQYVVSKLVENRNLFVIQGLFSLYINRKFALLQPQKDKVIEVFNAIVKL